MYVAKNEVICTGPTVQAASLARRRPRGQQFDSAMDGTPGHSIFSCRSMRCQHFALPSQSYYVVHVRPALRSCLLPSLNFSIIR